MKHYPVMLDLSGKRAVIIGGGEVALRKLQGLQDTGALVKIIAESVSPEMKGFARDYGAEIIERRYAPGDLHEAYIVFCAIDDCSTSAVIARECRANQILCNMAGGDSQGNFIVPSFEHGDGYTIAASTNGSSPALAARLRRSISQAVPERTGRDIATLSSLRLILSGDPACVGFSSKERGHIIKKIAASEALLDRSEELINRQDREELYRIFSEALSAKSDRTL